MQSTCQYLSNSVFCSSKKYDPSLFCTQLCVCVACVCVCVQTCKELKGGMLKAWMRTKIYKCDGIFWVLKISGKTPWSAQSIIQLHLRFTTLHMTHQSVQESMWTHKWKVVVILAFNSSLDKIIFAIEVHSFLYFIYIYNCYSLVPWRAT